MIFENLGINVYHLLDIAQLYGSVRLNVHVRVTND
jgi:hypothetical protein